MGVKINGVTYSVDVDKVDKVLDAVDKATSIAPVITSNEKIKNAAVKTSAVVSVGRVLLGLLRK